MKITFIIGSAYGMGGTIRATLTLANHFAERHDVEIITLHRRRATSFFPIDERVKVRSLIDLRKGSRTGRLDTVLSGHNSRLVPRSERIWSDVTLRGDYRLWRALRDLDSDVLITTRPAFSLLAARFVPGNVVVIGQEHLHLGAHRRELQEQIGKWYPRLDALVTLTEADHDAYAEMLAGEATVVRTIANPLPAGPRPPAPLTAPVVAAAGRMAKVKHYERLITAFATVAAAHPGWTLRLYGTGPELQSLRAVAEGLGLDRHVRFMGRSGDIDAAFAEASVVALSSSFEGFGMTIIEAFARGVPVVSTDCPHGPGEIIAHGETGLLVPVNDQDALARAIMRLIENPEERRAMGAAAHRAAGRYGIAAIAAQWEELFAELLSARRRPYGGHGAAVAAFFRPGGRPDRGEGGKPDRGEVGKPGRGEVGKPAENAGSEPE